MPVLEPRCEKAPEGGTLAGDDAKVLKENLLKMRQLGKNSMPDT